MKNIAAKTISFLFHPLLLPSYAIILLFFFPSYLSHYQYEYKKIIVLIIFLMTFIFPLLILMVLLNTRTISSLNLWDRKERVYPYAITSIVYITAYYITINFPAGIPNTISNFVLISVIIIFVVMLINFKIKVSAHMAGIGGFLSFFYSFFLKENTGELLFSIGSINFYIIHFFIILFVLTGIIASSRLKLNAHNPGQILLGFFIGFVIGLMNVFFS